LTVRQDAAGNDGPDVHVDITDSGIGLGPAQLERLFEPFNRVGAERTGVEATGWGWRTRAPWHARWGARSPSSGQPGQGSCFTLHLRRAADFGHGPETAAAGWA